MFWNSTQKAPQKLLKYWITVSRGDFSILKVLSSHCIRRIALDAVKVQLPGPISRTESKKWAELRSQKAMFLMCGGSDLTHTEAEEQCSLCSWAM